MPARSLKDLERDAFLAQADQLVQLIEHPCWPAYQQLLAAMRLSAMEEMARTDATDFRYWQGVVGTLAEILDRPQQIVDTATAVKEAEAADSDPVRIREAVRTLMQSGATLEGDL
jgi:hypothetical protein